MPLIDTKTKQPINIGDRCTTFRGEQGTIIYADAPLHEGSTGRVGVKLDKDPTYTNSWFPSVIGAEWIDA